PKFRRCASRKSYDLGTDTSRSAMFMRRGFCQRTARFSIRHSLSRRIGSKAAALLICGIAINTLLASSVEAQTKKVRVAVPGYTIAVLSFLAAKMNGYYSSEGLDVELIAMRAPTANLALIGGNVEFSAVPLA